LLAPESPQHDLPQRTLAAHWTAYNTTPDKISIKLLRKLQHITISQFWPNQREDDKNECSHNLVRVTHNVPHHFHHVTGSN
jgi:hypothetical protein